MNKIRILPALAAVLAMPCVAFAQKNETEPVRLEPQTVTVAPVAVEPRAEVLAPREEREPVLENEGELALRMGVDGRTLFVESCLPHCDYAVLIGLKRARIPLLGFTIGVEPLAVMRDEDGRLNWHGAAQLHVPLENAWLAGVPVYFQAVALEFDPEAIHVSSVLAEHFREPNFGGDYITPPEIRVFNEYEELIPAVGVARHAEDPMWVLSVEYVVPTNGYILKRYAIERSAEELSVYYTFERPAPPECVCEGRFLLRDEVDVAAGIRLCKVFVRTWERPPGTEIEFPPPKGELEG